MRCPVCGETALPNDDATWTCINCGQTFNPADYRVFETPEDETETQPKPMRSCVVTLNNGEEIKLTFSQDLEPNHINIHEQCRWRAKVETQFCSFIQKCFDQKNQTC